MPTVNRQGSGNHTQSVLFTKAAGWTKESSRSWLGKHKLDGKRDYYTDGHEETDSSHRWRQYDPNDSKFRYRPTVIEEKNGKPSISLVRGYPVGSRQMQPSEVLNMMPRDTVWAIPEEGFDLWLRTEPVDIVWTDRTHNVEAERPCLFLWDDYDNTHPEAARLDLPRTDGTVAVVPVHGVIHQRPGWMGGVSTDVLGGLLGDLAANPDIGAVVLDMDSPGGTVPGTPELAEQIRGMRAVKPVYAVANSEAASGAYWISSQANKLYVTPSGLVGSVGVFMAHVDFSEALAKQGIKATLVSAGRHKTERSPLAPLSPEAQAAMQAQVDEAYGMMVAAIARGRGRRPETVRSGFGEGRMVGAERAVDMGMADGIATLPEVLSQIVPRKSRGSRRASVLADLAIQEMELE